MEEGASTDGLLGAVAGWVKDNGGSVLVIGPVQIAYYPEYLGLDIEATEEFKFEVRVPCLGKRPAKD